MVDDGGCGRSANSAKSSAGRAVAMADSLLLSFLESVPEVAARLREPESKERKFEDVVRSAEQAAVLVY